jgi:hypothetical protein
MQPTDHGSRSTLSRLQAGQQLSPEGAHSAALAPQRGGRGHRPHEPPWPRARKKHSMG